MHASTARAYFNIAIFASHGELNVGDVAVRPRGSVQLLDHGVEVHVLLGLAELHALPERVRQLDVLRAIIATFVAHLERGHGALWRGTQVEQLVVHARAVSKLADALDRQRSVAHLPGAIHLEGLTAEADEHVGLEVLI